MDYWPISRGPFLDTFLDTDVWSDFDSPRYFDPMRTLMYCFPNRREDSAQNKMFTLNWEIGDYKNEDIQIKVDEGRLLASGARKVETAGGYEQKQFSRECELPADVEPSTMRYKITRDGHLLIQFERKRPVIRKPIADESKDDTLILKFDVEGFEQKNVQLHIDGNVLVLEGAMKCEETGKEKSFKRTFLLRNNVDKSTLAPVWKGEDGYLVVTGKMVPESNTIKKLEIASE